MKLENGLLIFGELVIRELSRQIKCFPWLCGNFKFIWRVDLIAHIDQKPLQFQLLAISFDFLAVSVRLSNAASYSDQLPG